MCGERFSSKFTPEQKAAAAAPHPLARPDRWSVVYTNGLPDAPHRHDRAFFDDSDEPGAGYATEAEARKALAANVSAPVAWLVLPPQRESGDHRTSAALAAGKLTQEDLVAFADAVLNNREAEFERLRVRFAGATLVAPPAPKLTRAEAAEQLVSLLVPAAAWGKQTLAERFDTSTYGPGNAVTAGDFGPNDDRADDGDPEYDSDGDEVDRVYYSFDPDFSRRIHAAVRAYVEADVDAPAADADAAWGAAKAKRDAVVDAARHLAEFLTDETGDYGNSGSWVDLGDDDQDSLQLYGENVEGLRERLQKLVDALG